MSFLPALLVTVIANALVTILILAAAGWILRRRFMKFRAEIEAAIRAQQAACLAQQAACLAQVALTKSQIAKTQRLLDREIEAGQRAEQNIRCLLEGLSTSAITTLERLRALESKNG